ncbi:hypothetical protein CCR94_07880 [Rhodoblastus sphagnicola]|uniref:Uncharacterized protein n=1 Tax=Rhodoblastus sphagnicola TaxID=333368 RepID=A0A2S6NBB0_9HYPH|nr:hypothetical protein [Rhodoblastus sphagnicola]MBB4197736.1 hypothetical protein [Rhodoblastus sphagnicola]PPQ31881.1 hypothetical protein CCR94_07880 [Rhodoblastus sphagnicola]
MEQNRRTFRAFGLLLATGFASGLFVQFNAPSLYFAAPHKEAPIQRVMADAPPVTAPDARQPAAQDESALTSAIVAAPAADPSPAPDEAAGITPSENDTETAEGKPFGQKGEPPVEQVQDTGAEEKAVQEKAGQEKIVEEKVAGQKPEDEKTAPPGPPTPALLRRYEAIAAVIGNTLEITRRGGDVRHVYFAPRGLVADFDRRGIEARQWSRDDDHLCRALGADMRECFYLAVELDAPLRKGAAATLDARIRDSAAGTLIGKVRGFGEGEVRLLRGDIRGLPDYVPLMDDKPDREWTDNGGEGFVGALLLRRAEDANRAAAFFAPNGQVFEVARLTRRSVSLWIGAWRRQGDLVCRTINPTQSRAEGRGQDGAAEECAHARVSGDRIEFAEAAPTRRAYLRWPWPDEDGARANHAAQAAEVNLAPATRSDQGAFSGAFTDLR